MCSKLSFFSISFNYFQKHIKHAQAYKRNSTEVHFNSKFKFIIYILMTYYFALKLEITKGKFKLLNFFLVFYCFFYFQMSFFFFFLKLSFTISWKVNSLEKTRMYVLTICLVILNIQVVIVMALVTFHIYYTALLPDAKWMELIKQRVKVSNTQVCYLSRNSNRQLKNSLNSMSESVKYICNLLGKGYVGYVLLYKSERSFTFLMRECVLSLLISLKSVY